MVPGVAGDRGVTVATEVGGSIGAARACARTRSRFAEATIPFSRPVLPRAEEDQRHVSNGGTRAALRRKSIFFRAADTMPHDAVYYFNAL